MAKLRKNFIENGQNVTREIDFADPNFYQPHVEVGEADLLVDTGLTIKTGDRLIVSASGEIWAGVWFTGTNGPMGWNWVSYDRQLPLPGWFPFGLIGQLSGRLFPIGTGIERVYTGRASKLFLRTNDNKPGNGSGAFVCHIEVWRKV